MFKLISSILISESKKIEEYSAQNRRSYQHDYDRLRQQLVGSGLNPNDFNDVASTAGMRKLKKALDSAKKAKDENDLQHADLTSVQDKVDKLYDELEIMGKSDIADKLLQQSYGKDDQSEWLLDQYEMIIDPEQGWADKERDLEDEGMAAEMPPEDMEGYGTADHDVNDILGNEEENVDSNVRRFTHLALKIMRDLDISKTEMASLMDKLKIEYHIIDQVFPTMMNLEKLLSSSRIKNIAAARAIKKIKNADPEIAVSLKDSLNSIMQSGTYRESVKLAEDIAILTESGMELIPAGTRITVVD